MRTVPFDDTIKCGKQGPNLTLPSVKFLGNQQPLRRVAFAECKIVDPALRRLPFDPAAAKVAFETSGGLIAVFGQFREQLHDDR